MYIDKEQVYLKEEITTKQFLAIKLNRFPVAAKLSHLA